MATRTQMREYLAQAAPQRWRWYHGALFYVFIQALTFGISGLVSRANGRKARAPWAAAAGDLAYFSTLKEPLFAPPAWAFGPAWTINNISVIWGTLRVLNMPRETPGRTTYLALQAATWVDYVLFSAAYFGLRSPLNAAVITMLYLGLTVASGFVAIFKLKDTAVALSLATLFVWLLIATPTGVLQALWNRDAFYASGPVINPPNGWYKRGLRG